MPLFLKYLSQYKSQLKLDSKIVNVIFHDLRTMETDMVQLLQKLLR